MDYRQDFEGGAMRKRRWFLAVCVFLVLLVGCSHPPVYYENIRSFSLAEDMALYSENSSNVQYEGFVNTDELDKSIDWDADAIKRAEKECSVQWDNVHTYFDLTANVWKIEFWDTRDTEGYPMYVYQTVYLNRNGVTLLVVYGE